MYERVIGVLVAAALGFCLGGCESEPGSQRLVGEVSPAPAPAPAKAKAPGKVASAPADRSFGTIKAVEHGRLEDHAGLRILRLWGDPAQRGRAHAELLGAEMVDLGRRELTARFASRPQLLTKARAALPLLVHYPEPIKVELVALFASIEASGVDRRMPDFDRDLDVNDLLLLNAMDILAVVGCSGVTLWGDQVEGGGVLTGRNFDWRLTGDYMVDRCILLVQHPDDGHAFAAVGWPGYVGAVTGISELGIAVFLHVGNSDGGWPLPGMPTAMAAREILRDAEVTDAFAAARENLGGTKPPAGYLTRVVLPTAARGQPARVFERDLQSLTWRKDAPHCVVTNHFLSRRGDRDVSRDSAARRETILETVRASLSRGGGKATVADVWSCLSAVERGGSRFGTLHSLVFRHDPWVFELAIGEVDGRGVKAATRSSRRYRLTRDEVFGR